MQTLYTRKIIISGISCGACSRLISKRLQKIDGVKKINIEDKTGEAEITSSQDLDINAIRSALVGTQYKIANIRS